MKVRVWSLRKSSPYSAAHILCILYECGQSHLQISENVNTTNKPANDTRKHRRVGEDTYPFENQLQERPDQVKTHPTKYLDLKERIVSSERKTRSSKKRIMKLGTMFASKQIRNSNKCRNNVLHPPTNAEAVGDTHSGINSENDPTRFRLIRQNIST